MMKTNRALMRLCQFLIGKVQHKKERNIVFPLKMGKRKKCQFLIGKVQRCLKLLTLFLIKMCQFLIGKVQR